MRRTRRIIIENEFIIFLSSVSFSSFDRKEQTTGNIGLFKANTLIFSQNCIQCPLAFVSICSSFVNTIHLDN
jgi:uncharacterized membrane protein YhdT